MLKFRAWDKKEEKYIYSEQFENLENSRQLQWFFNFIKDKDVIIEQFIGSKDKNNKEIYVGDICNLKIRLIQGVIKQECGCFVLKDNDSSSVFTGLDTAFSSLEIIGNIREKNLNGEG